MTKAQQIAMELCLVLGYPDQTLIARAANELLRLQDDYDSERKARIHAQTEIERMRDQQRERQS